MEIRRKDFFETTALIDEFVSKMFWPHLFHFFHIRDLLRKFSVLHELKVVGLELVLEGGHVVGVLLAVLRQRGHLAPTQTFHCLDVSKFVLLVLRYRPEEVGILLAVAV